MSKATYLATDVETGGIGPDVSLLTAYVAILDENMEIIDELELAMKPDDKIYHVTAEALAINKINLIEHDKDERTISFGKAGELLRDLIKLHSEDGKTKLIPLGHNVAFDMDNLYRNVLNKKEAQKYISYRVLDTGSTGRFLITAGLIPETVSGSLGSYVEHFKVEKREAHTARGDVLMTVDLMKAMIALSSRSGGRMTRQQANREILRILSTLVEIYPDQRFHQLLVNSDVLKTDANPKGPPTVRNEYHAESVDLLERIKKCYLLEVR